MGERTSIEWCHRTFSPWIGCTKVHTGCTNCYAETLNARYKYNGGSWGKGAERHVVSEATWRKPLTWAKAAAKAGDRERVFPSLCDVLDEEAPAWAQERLWNLIRVTARRCACGTSMFGEPDHSDHRPALPSGGLDWLLLTKRPERWRFIPEDVRPLVWLGTSISDQKTADEWVPRLLAAEGFRLRFLSVEPMIGPVDLTSALSVFDRHGEPSGPRCNKDGSDAIGWVICGGESGTDARPFDIGWGRSLRDQCRAAGVPFFMKQDSALRPGMQGRIPDELWACKEFPHGA